MNLNINAGEIRLTINNDPDRVIIFNPSDTGFAERFLDLISEFESKAEEYSEKARALDKNIELDAYGLPVNAKEKLALIRDACNYFRGQIDKIFGAGTSDTVFGSVNTLDMFAEFFEGISPFVEQARSEKMQKYAKVEKQNRAILK